MRFDFTHFEAVTPEELRAIEEQVNEEIWKATPVTTIETDIDTAKSMGAMALFGEKYGKNVRVVSIGDYSVELCGGTHVANTSEIGTFKIISHDWDEESKRWRIRTLPTLPKSVCSRLSKKKVSVQEHVVSWQ